LKFSQPISEVSKRHGILCITAEQKHKNLLAGIQAYANLPKFVRSKHPFFVVGIRSNGFKKYILKKAKNYGVNVIILPYLSELEMSSLLSKCRVLLIPSFAEGLSLPLLDALNHDLLVLGSRGTVVDEILNSPISTFNPERLHQIVKVLSLFLLDDALWKSTLNQQKERVTTFTWSATAMTASKKLTELILAVKSNE
jgi:glycosyltransferase involved in cell wall biosynthesis